MTKVINRRGAPQPFVLLAENDEYDAGKCDYSATGLAEEPRVASLKRQYRQKIEVDPFDSLWAIISTAFHKALSLHPGPNQVAEERLFAEIDGKVISGAMDLQTTVGIDDDFNEEVVIGDYKICSTYSLDDVSKFEAQLNVYAWLVESNHPSKKVVRLEVHAFLRDWSISRAERDPAYPRGSGVTIEVPLWDQAKREAYIRERILAHESCKDELSQCSHEGRWPIAENFKIVKTGKTRAISGHSKYKSEESALEALESLDDPEGHEIIHSFDGYRRCKNYCEVSQWCSQYKEWRESNE